MLHPHTHTHTHAQTHTYTHAHKHTHTRTHAVLLFFGLTACTATSFSPDKCIPRGQCVCPRQDAYNVSDKHVAGLMEGHTLLVGGVDQTTYGVNQESLAAPTVGNL